MGGDFGRPPNFSFGRVFQTFLFGRGVGGANIYIFIHITICLPNLTAKVSVL